jgi:hypothetical protein
LAEANAASGASAEQRRQDSRWEAVLAWTAVIGTVVAIIGVVIAYEQAHLADVTNEAAAQQARATSAAADQQALVAVVGDIANLSRSLSDPGAAVALLHEEMAVEAREGLALEAALPAARVPTIDNLELGVGFEPAGDLGPALRSFTRAGADPTDPVSRSKALRAAAAILYTIGGRANADRAYRDSLAAYYAFSGKSDAPIRQIDVNHELVDSWDAYWSAGADCPGALARAAGELQQARQVVVRDPAARDVATTTYVKDASNAVAACRRGRPIQLPYPPYVPAS